MTHARISRCKPDPLADPFLNVAHVTLVDGFQQYLVSTKGSALEVEWVTDLVLINATHKVHRIVRHVIGFVLSRQYLQRF